MAKRETLNFNQELYAYQEFKFNGRTYKPGEFFDWKRASVSHRQVAMLYNARRIRHHVKISQPQTQLPTDPPPNETQTQLPTDPPPNETQAEPAPTAATLVHTGAGWYNVEVEGLGAVNESKLKGKDAAIEWATANGYVVAE